VRFLLKGPQGQTPRGGRNPHDRSGPGLANPRPRGLHSLAVGSTGRVPGTIASDPRSGLDLPWATVATTSLPGATPRPGSVRSATQDRLVRVVMSPRLRSRPGAVLSPRPRPNQPEDWKRGAKRTAALPCAWGALGAGLAEGGPRAAPSLAGGPAVLRRPGGEPRAFLPRLRRAWSHFCRCSPTPIPLSGRGSIPRFKPWRKSGWLDAEWAQLAADRARVD